LMNSGKVIGGSEQTIYYPSDPCFDLIFKNF